MNTPDQIPKLKITRLLILLPFVYRVYGRRSGLVANPTTTQSFQYAPRRRDRGVARKGRQTNERSVGDQLKGFRTGQGVKGLVLEVPRSNGCLQLIQVWVKPQVSGVLDLRSDTRRRTSSEVCSSWVKRDMRGENREMYKYGGTSHGKGVDRCQVQSGSIKKEF